MIYIIGKSSLSSVIYDMIWNHLQVNPHDLWLMGSEDLNELIELTKGRFARKGVDPQSFIIASQSPETARDIENILVYYTDDPLFEVWKSPYAEVSSRSEIKGGTVLLGNVHVGPDSQIGKHCIIEPQSVIGPDAVIGDFVRMDAHVSLDAGACIGSGTILGSKSIVLAGVRIGADCNIGPGVVVSKDLEDNTVVKREDF